MTAVDFYVLQGNADDARLVLACRIAEKAMLRSQHAFINSTNSVEANRLDDLLWTFAQGSFVPHRVLTGTESGTPVEPVLIGHEVEPPGEPWDVLINLATEVPEYFSRYAKVVEVVDADEQRRERGRERYRYYRDRGYTLKTHQV